MSEQPEEQELEGPLAVEWPDPVFLQAPDGTCYAIMDEGALCAALGVESVMAYRATEGGLEWLTEKRRWESVESAVAGPKAVSKLKN